MGYSPGDTSLAVNNFGDDETRPVQAAGVIQLNDRSGSHVLFQVSTRF